MSTILKLLLQPSSFAGYAALAGAVPLLLSDPSNTIAWGAVFAALAAIFRSEAPRA